MYVCSSVCMYIHVCMCVCVCVCVCVYASTLIFISIPLFATALRPNVGHGLILEVSR
jgi:hypothetical protein